MQDKKSNGISVIIPVYNSEMTLGKCLDSILEQTFKDLEIICVIDRESDDKSEMLADEYTKYDSRVKVVKGTDGFGPGYNRNVGIDVATMPYISFIDSDDYIDKDFYERLYDSAQVYDSDVTMTQIKFIYSDTGETKLLPLHFVVEYLLAKKFMASHNSGLLSKLFKADLLKNDLDLRFSDTNIYEYGMFMLKVFHKCNKLVATPGSYYYHIIHPDSVSFRLSQEQQAEDANFVMHTFIDYLKKNNFPQHEAMFLVNFMIEDFGYKALNTEKYSNSLQHRISKITGGVITKTKMS